MPVSSRPARRRGIIGGGLAPALQLGDVSEVGVRRASTSSIIAAIRSALTAGSELPFDPRHGFVEIDAALGWVAGVRERSRLRSRAASSSSSWPTWASENPASSRRLLMNRSRSRSLASKRR